jgi:hypothetical protein
MLAQDIVTSTFWLEGPTWLSQSLDVCEIMKPLVEPVFEEMVSSSLVVVTESQDLVFPAEGWGSLRRHCEWLE